MRRTRQAAAPAAARLAVARMLGEREEEELREPPAGTRSRRLKEGAVDAEEAQQSAPHGKEKHPPPQQRRAQRRKTYAIPTPHHPCFSLRDPGCRVHIATSGYSYAHWHCKGSFYAGLPKSAEFEAYSAEFNSVELNGTFYGWFSPEVFIKWREAAAAAHPSFHYIVKASMFYTHKKRLNVDDVFRASWGRFWERCELLRPHLGPVLFQLPANFRLHTSKGRGNLARLRALGDVLPRGEHFVFEFRDESWLVPEVYEVMRQHDWCLAIADVTGGKGGDAGWYGTLRRGSNPAPEKYPLDACSWGIYIRLHGATGQYEGAYGPKRMAQWAEQVEHWLGTGRSVYVAFNNTDAGLPPSAIADARNLAAALRARGVFDA